MKMRCKRKFIVMKMRGVGNPLSESGGKISYIATDTDTHTEAYFISLVFLRKCRNKIKNRKTVFIPHYSLVYMQDFKGTN